MEVRKTLRRCVQCCAVFLAACIVTPSLSVAKTVSMRPLSRSAVESACDRAGGAAFGTRETAAPYGCKTLSGLVVCTPDAGNCSGQVSDLTPMPSGAINEILGAGRSGQPVRLGPVDARVEP